MSLLSDENSNNIANDDIIEENKILLKAKNQLLDEV